MVKVLIVFGTRPEAIKMAPLVHLLSKKIDVKVCVTAQHREMLDQVLNVFDITPDYDLNIMEPNQDLFDLTSSILESIKKIIKNELPDFVLVHGDTTTSMVAALASFYLETPVAHVEAGLRTHNIKSPFPEELNRQIISRIAELHFAPTKIARKNLIDEGIKDNRIHITGNTVIDALLSVLKKARDRNFSNEVLNNVPFLKLRKEEMPKIILVTGHRRENFGKGFEEICHSLIGIAKKHPKVEIVYPAHLNPNVLEPVKRLLSNMKNIHLIKPLEYLSFVKLMDLSYLILTDSGGIQEEAPSLGKPVLVMRNQTERPEAVEAGTVKLVGTNEIEILDIVSNLIKNDELYRQMSKAHNPYGEGDSSKIIANILVNRGLF